jgi:prepilin-type N-terminal cleavage/methylation domain-containing protein
MQLVMRPVVLSLPRRDRGFTLIEIAIALFIITLILGSLLVPLTTQVAQRKTSDTQKTLEDIKEALVGFAVSNGRLPCPASATSNGVESFCTNGGAGACGTELPVPPNDTPGHGRCFSPYNGFAPAITLGLQAAVVPPATLGRPWTDPPQSGYAIDAWGTPIRYAVTTANLLTGVPQYDFTAPNGMRSRGMAALAPDLHVCESSTGITATDCGTAKDLTGSTTVKWAPAVIYSLGLNWATGGNLTPPSPTPPYTDEAANPNPNSANNDQVFVSHVRSGSSNPNGEFDDIVTWLSKNVLYSRMVSAEQLP